MSADLFAAFGDLSQPQQQAPTPPKNQGAPHPSTGITVPVASDPLSFLVPGPSVSQTQQGSQKSTPWPPLQQPTGGQPSSWLTSPVNEPAKSNAWGDIGSSGGIGSVQGQTMPFPAVQEPATMQEDDDGWGDFEVAQDSSPAQPAAAASASTSTNPAQPRTRVIRASTLDLLSNRLLDLSPDTSAPEPWQQRPSWETNTRTQPPPKPAKPARHPDPNVLFDADFETENGTNGDDADEFGDFVSGTPASRAPETAPAASALDLLSLDSAPAAPKKQPPGLLLSNAAFKANPSSYPEAPKSPYGSFQERKPEPVKQLQVSPPKVTKVLEESNQASPSPVTAWPTVEHDGFGGKWEEFKDLPETSSQPAAAAKPLSKLKPNSASTSARATASDWDWQDWGGTEAAPSTEQTTAQRPPTSRPTITATEEDKPGPPPTNIPPPAILLSLFPQLLDLASASLLKPLLTLSPSSPAYQRVLASEATLTFLRGYLALATVAARLIAGRKLRWHRDKFLAQGMSISAASPAAAGQRGMKLASVDKSQAAREDREAAEVAQLWKAQVGRLRAVVAGVNAAHAREGGSGSGPGLRVPEIAVGLAVSTAKGVPTAPKACVVCGLKRDERVAKVDVQVEDSFGEWWVDFWGHRECRNFWLRHERELRQR